MLKSYLKKIFIIGIILLFGMSFFSSSGVTINSKYVLSIEENNPSLTETTYLKNFNSQFENPPNEIWNKTFGGDGLDFFTFIQQTSDNGYIIIGYTKSYDVSKTDIWLVKTDIDGDEEWNKTYGGPYSDFGNCVKETTDGGFILIGYYGYDDGGPYDVWLIKTDNIGNIIWEKKFNGEYTNIYGKSIVELNDGYILLAQIYNIDIPLKTDIWLIRTDFEGNELWNKYLGVNRWDTGNAIIQDSEGNFVIVGDTYSSIYGDEVLLIKTDEKGNRIWRKTYDGWEGFDIKESNDGNYIISGRKHVCLIKIKKNGNLLWKHEYQWGGFDVALSVDISAEGGFIICGNAGEGSDSNLLIFKTDENGNREWENSFGSSLKPDGGSCIIQSNDGTYIVAGLTNSYNDNMDGWLVKVAPFENQRPSKPILNGPTDGKIGIRYNYTVKTTEPDDENLFYWFDWGDSYTPWQGPFQSDDNYTHSKKWYERGSYLIKVKARDPYGGDSEWTTLKVYISKNKVKNSFNRLMNIFRYKLLLMI